MRSYTIFHAENQVCFRNIMVITITMLMGIACLFFCLMEKFNRGLLPPSIFFGIIVFYLVSALLASPDQVHAESICHVEMQPVHLFKQLLAVVHQHLPEHLLWLLDGLSYPKWECRWGGGGGCGRREGKDLHSRRGQSSVVHIQWMHGVGVALSRHDGHRLV